MDRRSLLKNLGMMAGLGTLTADQINVVEAEKDDDLIKTHTNFATATFQITDTSTSFPLNAACSRMPKFTLSRKNKNKVFINRAGNDSVDIEGPEALLATHIGVHDATDNQIRFSGTPEHASVGGSYHIIRGSEGQKLDVNVINKHNLAISLLDSDLKVGKGDQGTKNIQTNLKYGVDQGKSADVNISLQTHHWGKVKVYSHKKNFIFNKTDKTRKLMKSVKQERGRQTEDVVIKKHKNVYELVLNGGAR